MKKIDVSKSLIFSRNVEDLKNSLDYLYQDGYCSKCEDFSLYLVIFIPKLKAVFIEE